MPPSSIPAREATTGATRGPYAKGIERRRQVIESATRVFGQHGYRGGSLRQIADEIGVSASALIRYFGTKAALFAAVLEHSDAENDDQATAHRRGLDYLRGFATLTHINVHNRGLVQLLLSIATESTHPDHPAHDYIAHRYARILARVQEAIREASESGDLQSLDDDQIEHEARGLIATMDGLGLQWLIDPSMDLEATGERVFNELFARLAGPA